MNDPLQQCSGDACIFAIVLNYRQPLLTIRAVERLLASEDCGRELHVIVVDNGSDEAEYQQLRSALPHVRIIRSFENRGFAGGNNLGLRAVLRESQRRNLQSCDTYVLLLNNDVEVEPDTLRLSARFLDENSYVGVVGPRVLLPDGSLDLACRRSFPTPQSAFWKLTGLARRFPNDRRFARYNLTYLDEHKTADVDSVMGAFMLVRLAAIERAGLLDESFFMYGEDLDWSYRIKAYGWRIVYYPDAVVWHLKGATTRRRSYRMIVEFYRAMWLFYKKHQARRMPFLLNFLVAAGILARGAIALCLNATRPVEHRRVA